jgi:hypothetical protein
MEQLVKMTLEGAQAKVIVDGKISNTFLIDIGARQGDGLSATLFSLVLHKALKYLEQSNVILNRLTQICGYADDILEIARSLPALEALCVELSGEAGRVGLVVRPKKTKYMKFVAEFIYLGTLISNDNSIEKEIQSRILASNRTYFAAMSLFRSHLLSRGTRIQLYKTLIRPVVSYGAET